MQARMEVKETAGEERFRSGLASGRRSRWLGGMRLPVPQARSLAADALRGLGLEEEAANVAAGHLLDAHARQDPSTGLGSILTLERRLALAGNRSRPITTVRETPTLALVDGGGNVGYVVAHHATRLAMDKATKHGISCVGANNTRDLGRLAYYVELAARSSLLAACAALVQGSARADDGGPAPALLARMLAAMGNDPHSPVRPGDDVAFVIMVVDPRRLTPGVELPGWWSVPHAAPEDCGPARFIEVSEQLHRSLLELREPRPAALSDPFDDGRRRTT